MSRTLLFAKLDYLTIKPYLTVKNILIFLFVFTFVGYGTGEVYTVIGMLMMYATIYASYPFAVGDKSGIDILYATLPLKKRTIVTGRYIFTLCLNIIVSIIAVVLSGILLIILGKENQWKELFLSILVCLVFFSVIQAIQLPIYFKSGYAKAKFLAYLPLVCFPAAVMLVSAITGREHFQLLIDRILSWIQIYRVAAIALGGIIWLMIILVSKYLSYHFYRKREF